MDFRRGLRTPTLTKYIKGILEQYPDDGQILKELIQNADDAGAKTVRFVLDEGHYDSSPEGLIHPDMEQFQGPALLVYNDAVFTDDDWNGICMMQDSIKAKDVVQTGRFGLGFKSIFHVTDIPIIASGNYIGIIDPHQRYLPYRESAYNWHIRDEKDFLQDKLEQFRPLFKGIFGLDTDIISHSDSYSHTAFRFPLRKEASPLSNNIYTTEKVLQLFHSLEVDKGQSLLFLKSVQSIEIYRQSEQADEPKLLYRMKIADQTVKQVSERREAFLGRVRKNEWRSENVETILQMTLEAEHFKTCDASLETNEWLVYHSCHGDKAVLDTADELNVLPWVGIALPLSNSAGSSDQMYESSGHLYATLPLPLDGTERTGLKFHIHAYFAMEQNRRHLRWPTPDQNEEDLDSIPLRWNQLLVHRCIPAAVVAFVKQLISSPNNETSITPANLYELMPNEDTVDSNWMPIVSYIYKELLNDNCLYSPAKNKGWLKVEDTICSDDNLPDKVKLLLDNILLTAAFPVAEVPPHVQSAVKKYSPKQPVPVSTTHIHKAIIQVTSTDGNKLEKEDALLLLQYFLDNGQPEELIGLPLLPLLSGEMAVFQQASASPAVFLSSKEHPAYLLPGLEHRLVDVNLEDKLLSSLERLAKTGKTNLNDLRLRNVLEILPQVLPSAWAEVDIAPWSPNDQAQPTTAWLKQIWEYLHLNSPDDEAWKLLESIHLLPMDKSQSLSKFSVGKRSILFQTDENTLPNGVADFLSDVGCIVLRECPEFVYRYKELLYHSVNVPTCQGITDALMSVGFESGEAFSDKVKQSPSLNEFLAYMSDSGIRLLSSKGKQFLFDLPLFSTVSDSGFQPSRKVSLNEVKVSGPIPDIPVSFPVPVIDITNEKVKYILEALDVCRYHRDSFSTIFRQTLFPAMKGKKYTDEQVEELLCYVMDHHAKVLLEQAEIAAEISELAIVESGSNKMVSPKELYDPRDPILSSFLGKEFFPHGKYHTTSERLICLERLGMRPLKHISSEVFLSIAKSLQTQPERSDDFIQLTKTLTEQAPQGKWWEKLRDVAFLSVVLSKPDGYPDSLPWKGSTVELLAPKDVCHIRYAKQAGSMVPIVDMNESILGILQAKITPTLDELITHLKQVVECYNSKEKSRYLVLLDEIYSSLAGFSESEIKESLEANSVSSWIWHGNGFKCADQILEDLEINLSPYYFALPPEMEMHKDLLHRCGVQTTMSFDIVLEVIAKSHMEGESQSPSTVAHDLHLAIKLLKVLCKEGAKTALVPIDTSDESKLCFKLALECTVGDESSEFIEDDDLFFVHPAVPKDVIQHFCIPTVMHRVLDGEEFNIESFGQSEPLTTRLHSVLDGYTDGLAVLKEMVQNADDAGATEVRLIYDMRENNDWKKSLLDPSMAELQGPSMWIYNNAVFTDEDFTNITKLNGGTKREKEDQIGTFGLGFNAVYNLTDVPSILSRDTLAIFDPHTTYLGRAIRDKSKPGLRISIGKKQGRLLSKYPDQFAPWKGVCGCNLEAGSENKIFNGTLFRLPLRGLRQSAYSKISDIVYDERNVLELIKMVHSKGINMLLFTQNVLKVSVSIIPKECGADVQMKDLFEIHKEPVEYLNEHGIQCDISSLSQAENPLAQKFINECSILKASVKSSNKDGKGRGLKSSMIIKSVIKTSDEGKDLLGQNCSKFEHHAHWIVSQSIEDMPIVKDVSTKQQPVGGIAIGLEKENERYKLRPHGDSNNALKASYFSFLPLPVKSPLAFHINGTFILDSSRRHLVQQTDHDKHLAGGAWNKGLMEGAVCTAYMTALSDIISKTAPNEDLTGILPVNRKNDLITSMSEVFWQRIIKDPGSLRIFLSQMGKVSLQDAFFLDQTFLQSSPELQSNINEVITSVFEGSNQTLVKLPINLEQTLREVDCEMLEAKMITEEVFFTKFFLPNMSSIPLTQRDRDGLLVKALKSTSVLVESALKSMACIPVSPEGLQLANPGSLIHPGGKAAPLYSQGESKFPAITCVGDNEEKIVLDRLCKLGMVKDNVSWEEVLQRSRNLTSIGPQEHKDKVQSILNYVRFKLTVENNEMPSGIQQALQNERFLPCELKPSDWILDWKGEDNCSGNEIYSIKEPLIACTQVPILRRDIYISADVGTFLGIKGETTGHPLSIDMIKRQVEQITSNEESIKHLSVRQSLEKIYKYLDKECIDEVKAEKIQRAFTEEKFLMVEDTILSMQPKQRKLVSAAACAYNPGIQAFPYMNIVSREKNGRLMKQLGIKDYFNSERYMASLRMLEKDSRGSCLDETGLHKVQQMLNGLYHQMQRENKTIQDFEGSPIYMPDAKGVLKPVEQLCYNDTAWIHTEREFPLIHSCIRNTVAAFLKVKELRAHALSERSHGITYSRDASLLKEIRSVLEAYPRHSQIVMELLQQADDAGATEIHFKLDPRKHRKMTVFGNGWKAMQGPSLCVTNDGKLNRDVLKGLFLPGNENNDSQNGGAIQSIYHFTDTPTVLAVLDDGTETLCAYDPTCQHIEGTSPQEPAMMYKDIPLLREFFPDVFECYQQIDYGCTGGTDFRFPLRTRDLDKKSHICEKAGNIEDVNRMLELLLHEGYQALLFMTSLKKIQITRLNDQGRFETEEITSTITKNEAQVQEFRQHLVLLKQLPDVRECKFKKAAYTLKLKKSGEKEEEWSVVQHCGLEKGHRRIEDPQCLKMQQVPRGGVAELRTRNVRRHQNLLLPSYQTTTLPVQVIGFYHSETPPRGDSSSTQSTSANWNEYITEVIANAYLDLIKSNAESVTSHRNSTDPSFKQNSDTLVRKYYAAFPKEPAASSPVSKPIVKRFYQLLTDEQVLPENLSEGTGKQWVTPSEACLVLKADEHKINVIKGANLCGLKIVRCDDSVQKMIEDFCDCDPQYLSAGVLLDFLRDKEKCDYSLLSAFVQVDRNKHDWKPGNKIVEEMITFCQTETSFPEKLDGTPLLVTADGQLRIFDRLKPVYKSPDMVLLSPCTDKFLHPYFIGLFKNIESPVFKDMDIEGFIEELERNFPILAQNKAIPLGCSIQPVWIRNLWEAIDRLPYIRVDLLQRHASHICIWNVKVGGTNWLYPINEMDKVFEKTQEERRYYVTISKGFREHKLKNRLEVNLHSVICTGDIPMSVNSSRVANGMLASFDRPTSVLHALHQYQQQQQKHVAYVFKQNKLLQYFTNNLNHFTSNGDLLRDLPMFETLTGEYVSLTGNCVTVIPSQVPMVDMDAWMRPQQGTLFLKERTEFHRLYSQLGCEFWTLEQVYTGYIFKQLELLSKRGHMIHMHFVLDNLGNSPMVLDAMWNLQCVRDIGDGYCKPCDLYDPTIALFEQREGEHLPAGDLRTPERLKVLRDTGMICSASKEMLATYAKRSPLKEGASLIIDYINRYVGSAEASEYLKFLSGIPFIPRKSSEKSAVCPDISDAEYVPLKGSVLVNHSNLVWAVAPLIEDYRGRISENVLVSAGVIIKPPCELVARNIVQLCQHGQSVEVLSIGERRKLSSLVDTCFNHLSTKLENGEFTDRDKSKLRDTMSNRCCIPVEQAHRFVKPNQAVVELTPNEEVKPYLYRLPDNLMNNKDLLMLIGVASKPSISAYQRVLAMIHDKFDSHVIDQADDIQAAKQSTRQVFKRIKKDRTLDVHNSLWLLSKKHQLYKSNSIVYGNNLGTESRLTREVKLLVDINLKVSIESLLEYFPGTHRPQLLTSVVREEVQHEGEKSTQPANKVKEYLASEAMDRGLQRLTHHIMVTNAQEDIDNTIDEKIAEVQGVMRKIQIASVQGMKTRLNSHMGVIGDWQEKMFFGERDTSVLYLECSSLEVESQSSNFVYMHKVLADMVNDLNKSFFRENFGVLMAVLSATPEKVNERLDEMGILPYNP